MVKKINEEGFYNDAIKGLSVVDFFATWCGPCKMLAPVLEEVSEELQDKISFYSLDVDENEALSIKYSIYSVPSLVVLKDGEKIAVLTGYKPKETLKKELESFL